MKVPGRRGWELGRTVNDPGWGDKATVSHREGNMWLWAWGDTPEERMTAALDAIDEFIMKRYIQLWEQIQADDVAEGSVRILR